MALQVQTRMVDRSCNVCRGALQLTLQLLQRSCNVGREALQLRMVEPKELQRWLQWSLEGLRWAVVEVDGRVGSGLPASSTAGVLDEAAVQDEPLELPANPFALVP